MQRNVPQRVIRHRWQLFFILLALFIVTVCICLVVFFYFLYRNSKILSPLARFIAQKSAASSVYTVSSLCKKDMLSCTSITQQNDGSIQFMLNNTTTVYLSSQKDINSQLASLQSIASQLTIKGKQLKTVDFRFQHVVVAF